jgi:heptosyltransferase-1
MKILIIRLSSLGDVLHNLPVLWDIRAHYQDAQVDWIIDEAFVDLLKPLVTTASFKGIDRVIPLALRRWKKNLKNGQFISSIQEFIKFKKDLRLTSYDLIIDTQGLIKSAVLSKLTRLASTGRIVGPANKTRYSGFETLTRYFYTEAVQIPVHLHAVERARWVSAAAIDVPTPKCGVDLPRFYPINYVDDLALIARLTLDEIGIHQPYVIFFHATSRADKRWPHESWVVIGRYFISQGIQIVLPWGSSAEKKISEALAKDIPGAIVPRSLSMHEIFSLIAAAKKIIGVDTGLVHVAAAFCKPTIEIYCNSWKENAAGYWSPHIHNLGDMGCTPSVDEVLNIIKQDGYQDS